MNVESLFTTKKGKNFATVLGVTVLVLSAVHYFYNIRIHVMQVRELKAKQKEREDNAQK